MTIKRLEHVNVVTTKLNEMVAWYEAILGLTSGPRPNFPFCGAWLYTDEVPVIHLVENTQLDRVGSEAALKLEHFAFSAKGSEEFERRLNEYGAPFQKIEIQETGLVQFHIADPDGNHLHVDFVIDE
ncbi:glyoxalase/bleomycin resistance protein/dioxygenase [Roseibium sp. TrichSKD4]|uniref:VOC family protein n=1 Tax=Roseibium sp. TrichSKD4 TaxID=744980 RepID=UPI0001E565EA|nr:VOC family protein [Roseibium sp. TrichSKD4]EFO34025.1 glyoxalase/bleomycin resistance protein/dioxygenase [Roseibium sp. TrichSKD4]